MAFYTDQYIITLTEMDSNNPYYAIDEKEIVNELKKLDNKVREELSKPNVDKKKLYELRFQQLMKGIYLTQNPLDL